MGTAQKDPVPVAQQGFPGGMGVQGMLGAVRGSHTARADTSPKGEESKEGSPPPRGGEWVLVAPCAGFELLRVSYKRVFKNL